MRMDEALIFIDELLDSPWYEKARTNGVVRLKQSTIRSKSYRRFALIEIRKFMASCPNHDPIMLLSKYREAMDAKACENKGESFKYVFGVIYEVATEVLDMLLVR